MKKRFGEVLLERGLITPKQVLEALELQRRRGMRFGAALVMLGHISETQLVTCLGDVLGLPIVNLGRTPVDMEAVRMVRTWFASEHDLFPYAVRRERGRTILSVAMSDPLDYQVRDELGFMADAVIEPRLARASEIDAAIHRYCGGRVGRAGHEALANPPLHMETDPGGGEEMTILRTGGGEEIVNTVTGEVVSMLMPHMEAARNAERRTPPPRDESGLLLTEEVAEEVPVDVTSGGVSPAATLRPTRTSPSANGSTDLLPSNALVASSTRMATGDLALGALIDATGGGAVRAEEVIALERKFWALMRILARKKLVTREEFLAELGDEQGPWPA